MTMNRLVGSAPVAAAVAAEGPVLRPLSTPPPLLHKR
jgi:hypothetical protein